MLREVRRTIAFPFVVIGWILNDIGFRICQFGVWLGEYEELMDGDPD